MHWLLVPLRIQWVTYLHPVFNEQQRFVRETTLGRLNADTFGDFMSTSGSMIRTNQRF